MTPKFKWAAIVTFAVTSLTFLAYEIYLRAQGYEIAYDDDGSHFANARRKVYLPKEEATVIIGTSRALYDIDLDLWQNLTKDIPIQLANYGSSPIPILKDLANDEKFKGRLIIDATESLFFELTGWSYSRPNTLLKFAHEETPSQRFSFHINEVLESTFVFLDKDCFSLSAILDRNLFIPREGIRSIPKYPVDFGRMEKNRNTHYGNTFENTPDQEMMRNVWLGFAKEGSKAPPIPKGKIDTFLMDVATHIDKIKARGGEVIFLRPPSSGPIWQGEKMGFTREIFWDKILSITKCQGLHFDDYPTINKFECPEYSHLSRKDASLFTKELVKILQSDFNWKFTNKINM
jgi:hypothetical protein